MNNKTLNWIKGTFLRLTSHTYPYGCEDSLFKEMSRLGVFPKDLQKDEHDNYFIKVGSSDTVFTSHFDTACKDQVKVNHKIKGNVIKTDGTSILGADDKAGVTIMLWMIQNKVPGLYYFFVGEEVGCIGSGMASKSPEFLNYKKVVSFDRRGTSSIITHQSCSRTCSDEFASELANQLNLSQPRFTYKKDDGGIYTDSAEFASIVPECTNVSVGYYNEHTHSESQDISHLADLAEACLFVNWENLPISRDPSKIEIRNTWSNYSHRTYSNKINSLFDDDTVFDIEGYESARRNRKKTRRSNSRRRAALEEIEEREYYDMGRGEIAEINRIGFSRYISEEREQKVKSSGVYDSLKDKFFDSRLSLSEIEIIKDQYLDMNDPRDRNCYKVLYENITSF